MVTRPCRLWGLTLLVLAAPGLKARSSTCNTAENRACWTDGFDINTDYEASTPFTGVTRQYTFTITEKDGWVGGDGAVRTKVMLVDGQFPGPTITADWGDRINVTFNNKLLTNGTSMHFHGIRQLNTNNMDGTGGVTECPTAPGGSQTYSFVATQYGTSWYHSHFSLQYAYGVLGPIVINGPASANYDIDLGPFPISDWYYGAIDDLAHRVNDPNNPFVPDHAGSPPTSDNILFNGTNINPTGTGGQYARVHLTSGKRHLLRLINPSVENTFTVSLVGHAFTVIAIDLVPVQPTTTTSLYMTVGQRYDVIIDASQPAGAYWFNATMSSGPCGTSKNPHPAAIFSYAGDLPTDPGTSPPDSFCADKLSYTPVVARTAPLDAFKPDVADTLTTSIEVRNDGRDVARVFWPVNETPINISWSHPTLQYVHNQTAIPKTANVISVPSANTTTFWLIQNNSSIPHPIHLHGHDMLILGASPALATPVAPNNTLRVYNPSVDGATLKGTNPTRRDTTTLPAWGWLVVAYLTNNPGAWLFHCHTAWHVSQGLSVQFLEQLDAIPQTLDLCGLQKTCDAWDAYFPAHDPYGQTDSGL